MFSIKKKKVRQKHIQTPSPPPKKKMFILLFRLCPNRTIGDTDQRRLSYFGKVLLKPDLKKTPGCRKSCNPIP